ncbi:substrate-binding domain-containing protein [Aggregatilinea lenta]|uniref:substrate-binding domain-containing protein n=1 Tax=Aggregatilinea lenta TaxID=913108 RepID=UPI001EE7C0D8|nr:substrate-binding domain-containing protein [Aggregatilinea lenta]
MSKKLLSVLLMITIAFGMMAIPAAAQDDEELTIFSSMPNMAFPFFVHMQNQIAAEADVLGNIEMLTADGQNSAPKQTGDVEAAIVQGVDGIIISPLDVAALAPAVEQAVEAGIPVVTIDRRVEGVDGILAHVGADNVLGGEAQANWVLENYPDGASIFHLQGQPGSGPGIDRNQGVHNVLDAMQDQYPIVFEQTANFSRDEALSVTEAGLAGLETPPDVIIAANDDMALGAYEAVSALGLGDQIAILGFDALPETLQSIQDGSITGTIEQFPGGQSRTALNILVDYLRNGTEPEESVVLLEPKMITADNISEAERIGELGGAEATEEASVEAQLAEALAACESTDELTLFSSMPNMAFPFFVHMQNQIDDETATIGSIELLTADGQNSAPKQTGDVEAAIVQGVDGIIISPLDVAALAPAVQQAVEAGIPVVTIDRRVEGVDGILAHVGADNVLGGEAQANWVLENYPDGASIFHLQGQPGAGPAIDRNQGVHNVLDAVQDQYPIVFEQTANFSRDEALSVTEAGLAGLETPPDVIIAANDDMALGAYEAVSALGLEDQIAILGFDALPETLQSIQDGSITGTIEQFPGGQSRTAVRIMVLELRGCEYEAGDVVYLTPKLITADNINEAERIGELGQ